MEEIQASVGRNGRNLPNDVRIVQRLLLARGFRIGNADGICGLRTREAIVAFQGTFMRVPDGRVDPGGRTLRKLHESGSVPTTETEGGSLTRLVRCPDRSTINNGIRSANNRFMLEVLGAPRSEYGTDCQPVTNAKLRRNIVTSSVGPIRVTGLRPAILSLQQVFRDIERQHVDVYRIIGTAGMLCCRYVRGSTTSISNHSWGTAIDLKLGGILDVRGNGRVQFGLTLIAPIFNRLGWYWGAGFRTEDAMHFEAGRDLVRSWAGSLE